MDTEKTNEEKIVKKQKPSATYTLKQMREVGNKLLELKLLNENEVMQLDELRQKAIERFYRTL